ncbi:acetyl-CoA carboxylase biotin carboxylase subunit family protein [Pseudomonas sp. PB106]|uniref:ATP-grasp domain-containing protein n=1 Tax=Pseudomonas sp. PB106 TaxID=2494699 RepID=UPI00131EC818|nr:biotin carboxylase [Pseudomonas sp. PB106]KAE9639602.1 biotin carboxylase [Pseudomonas sp. PB106]
MSLRAPVLLIVDYNLSRIADVRHLRDHARQQWGAQTWLVRANPQAHDQGISDRVIDADPLAADFINLALNQLGDDAARISAGIVFSDNAVASGAGLLERLGLAVDCAQLALGAFDKLAYRIAENRLRPALNQLGVNLPDFAQIGCIDDVRHFAGRQQLGFVIKPACEGNNRGVVMVAPGGDCEQAFAEVAPYLHGGVLAEAFISFTREYSYDGLGKLWFITEKVSATGRYPVEVAQILPARLSEQEQLAIHVAGEQVNRLVGQRIGPFHNEIKLSDDGKNTAVIEPNRRPGGMKIWTLAQAVYGLDLYAAWVDSVFAGHVADVLPAATCSAATVMFGVPRDITLEVAELGDLAGLIAETLELAAETLNLARADIALLESAWVAGESRLIHATPRDNSDFVAHACVALHNPSVDIRDLVRALREQWLRVLDRSLSVELLFKVAS